MALRLLSVGKSYGSHVALSGVSLNVRKGDCYGFLGHNGAGKTTALRIALGLIRPDAGRVIVGGFDAARFPREARARQGGLIETPGFYTYATGRANLRVFGRLRGLDRGSARREADRLLEAVGLSSSGDRKVGGYSQGMRQRLGIALALLGDPELVLLDEPTNGLDPEGIEEFRRLLLHLTRDRGRTVLLSSHQLKELSDVCNRIGILRRGRLLVEGETKELIARGGSRLLLRTDDPEAAAEVLGGMGLVPVPAGDDQLGFEAGEVEPAKVAKALVARNLEVRELAVRTETLEDIYLRYSREETPAVESGPSDAAVTAAPDRRIAPPFSVLRAMRHEIGRTLLRPGPVFALVLPALVAVLSVVRLWAKSTGHLEEVAGGELFSQTLVTAFEGVADALQTALPLGALILAGIASQSLAGELSRGTLRNLLLAPVGRVRLVVGKALGLLAIATGSYLLLVGAAVVASAVAFDFTDVVEILEIRTLEPYVLVKAADLWSPFRTMLATLLVPFAAWAFFGFAVGALTRRGVTALASAAGGYVFLDLFRVVGRELGFEGLLLSAYAPSPLGDTSWTGRMLDMIRAPNDLPRGFVDLAVTAPVCWIAAALLIAAFVVRRRSVP